MIATTNYSHGKGIFLRRGLDFPGLSKWELNCVTQAARRSKTASMNTMELKKIELSTAAMLFVQLCPAINAKQVEYALFHPQANPSSGSTLAHDAVSAG